MPKRIPPDLGIILRFLREGQGVSQAKLGELSRVSPNLINDYEQGRKRLTRGRLEHLITFMGLRPERIDETLRCLAANHASSQAPQDSTAYLSASRRRIETVVHQAGNAAMEFTRGLLLLVTLEGEGLQARERAGVLWARLSRKPHEERRLLIEDSNKYRTWALCERVAAESIEATGDDPQEALKLAELAVRIAELCPGSETWRRRLEGYAGIHRANAKRVTGDLPAARDALVRGKKLWEEGAPADPGLLNEAVVLGIEANLLRADRKFGEALKTLEEAFRADRSGITASLLYIKARILEGMDDLQGSTAALDEAAPRVDARRAPRLALGIRVQLLLNLCLEDRAAEAKPQLREVRTIAEALGNELDLARVLWVSGMVAAGTGQRAEAEESLQQVRRKMAREKIAYDYALVTLELAVVLLAENRTREVRSLATELIWIFSAQQVSENALAALRLFSEAARRETATLGFTCKIRRFLYRARHNPELELEEAGAAKP